MNWVSDFARHDPLIDGGVLRLLESVRHFENEHAYALSPGESVAQLDHMAALFHAQHAAAAPCESSKTIATVSVHRVGHCGVKCARFLQPGVRLLVAGENWQPGRSGAWRKMAEHYGQQQEVWKYQVHE